MVETGAAQRSSCSSVRKIGDLEWSMNFASSACSASAAAAPSGLSVATTRASTLSNREFCDAIEGLGCAPTGGDGVADGARCRVHLHVPADPEHRCESGCNGPWISRRWPMDLALVDARQRAAEAEHELDHVPRFLVSFSSSCEVQLITLEAGAHDTQPPI